MNCIKSIVFLFLSVSTAFAGSVTFPQYGFSIDMLDAKPTGQANHPLMMFLPINNNFHANVNVQIQTFDGPMDEYVELSESQFKQLDFKVLSSEFNKQQVIWEYTGESQGRRLHWYAKAIKANSSIYLVTAIDEQESWKTNKIKLKSTVDSFELK
ncbi:hypothetical protein R3X26_02995 [Vibrio sp. TH_r3]|uniref:hypothetical protein n=1 Tax=Vibrio sp. TH_r3 TaxID=3082084 RepID=UPI0029553143|nr:hypothetical protein [Vibrio sp. TH_r3]MDV7103367.1 hypothetical protein [Vibrio sp. TH_r3]